MDHIRILRRGFEIVRRYPVLWIFGFLLALASSHGGGSSNSGYQFGGGNHGGNGGSLPWPKEFPELFMPGQINTVIGVIIGLTCVIVLLGIALTVVSYVAEASAIRMVDRYEADGEKYTFRQGWRLGWSRAAFRLWLIDLICGVVILVVILVLLAIAAAPLLLWVTKNNVLGMIGTAATITMGITVILAIILISAALSLLLVFSHRAAVLEGLGARDSLRRGWQIIRRRPGDAIIMGLLLFGLGLLFGIVLIPVFLILGLGGVVIGGVPAVLVGFIVHQFVQGALPWVVAAIIGLPVLLLILVLPMTFISGLFEIFSSSAWTLAYREMIALEATQEDR